MKKNVSLKDEIVNLATELGYSKEDLKRLKIVGDTYKDENGNEATIKGTLISNWEYLTQNKDGKPKNVFGLTKEITPKKVDGKTNYVYVLKNNITNLYNSKGNLIANNPNVIIHEADLGRQQANSNFQYNLSAVSKALMPQSFGMLQLFIENKKECNVIKDGREFKSTVKPLPLPKDYVTFTRLFGNSIKGINDLITGKTIQEQLEDGLNTNKNVYINKPEVKKVLAILVATLEKFPNVMYSLSTPILNIPLIQDAIVRGTNDKKFFEKDANLPVGKENGYVKIKLGEGISKMTTAFNTNALKSKNLNSIISDELGIKSPRLLTEDMIKDELKETRAVIEAIEKVPVEKIDFFVPNAGKEDDVFDDLEVVNEPTYNKSQNEPSQEETVEKESQSQTQGEQDLEEDFPF